MSINLKSCLFILSLLFGAATYGQAPQIGYSKTSVTYRLNSPITALVPANTGGAVPATHYGQVASDNGNNNLGEDPAKVDHYFVEKTSDASGNLYGVNASTYIVVQTNNQPRPHINWNSYPWVADGNQGYIDAVGRDAEFGIISDISLDDNGGLIVADYGNNAIRKISLIGGSAFTYQVLNDDGSISTYDFPRGSVSTIARNVGYPATIAVDDHGGIYFYDNHDYKIHRASLDGTVTTIAGNGQQVIQDGVGASAGFSSPSQIGVDDQGNVLVKDGSTLRKVTTSGYTISPQLPDGLQFDDTNGSISGTPTVVSPSTDYIITAYNSFGSNSAMLNITVDGPSTNADLSNLIINTGTLTPSFASNIAAYSDSISNTAANHIIYTMGDSITADGGYQNTLDSLLNHQFTFANLGIPGDQTPGMRKRFTSVTSSPADYLIILGGVNDIQRDSTAAQVEANLQAMYTAGHNAGLKVVALTITPWKGNGGWTVARQAVQDTVNTWIRTAANVDRVVDTYAALSDPANPQAMQAAYDKGDHLHPGAAGQQKMGAAIYAAAALTPAADPGANITAIAVKPVASDSTASIKVNGVTVASGTQSANLPLSMGQNAINTVVTAQDGITTKTYTINVTRSPSSNADLANIVVNNGLKQLSPLFDKGTAGYTVLVNTAVNSISLLPVALKAGTTIKINGAAFSGISPAVVQLPQTSTNINIVATAEDNVTTKTYSITVTKAWVDVSTNALLSAVKLSPVSTLVVVNGPDFKDYTSTVPYSESTVKVIAASQDTLATIKVNGVGVKSGVSSGAIALNVGDNMITIVSTAQDTVTTNTYAIKVTRSPSTDATLATLTYTPAITKTTVTGTDYRDYVAKVANSFASISVIPVVHDATATVRVNGVAVASGATSTPIALKIGPNIINTVITAQDGVTTKTYKLTVTRLSNNAELTLLKLSPVSALTQVSGTDYKDYTAAAPNNETSVKVLVTTQDTAARVKVNGAAVASGGSSDAIPLNVGNNLVTTTVTAQDGTIKNYKITLTRAASADATLATLTYTPAITKTPVTGDDYKDYIATVPATYKSIAVIPVVHEPNAKVKVNGKAVASGATSAQIALAIGQNVISTVITAQDGITTKTYKLTVTRLASVNATLAAIKLSPVSALTTVTGPDYKDYTATAPYNQTSVKVIPTAQDTTAVISVNGMIVKSGATSAAIPLNAGANVITTVVTAQDGVTVKTYKITITRAPSTDATLATLNFTPAISKTTVTGSDYRDYTATVANSFTSIAVIPTVHEAHATVTVNGMAVASGDTSAPVSLNVGANIINTVVTAQDGVATDTYSLTITRKPASANMAYQLQEQPIAANNIIVHQSLSPNGDGNSDVLLIDGITAYPENKLQIINRGGELVYQVKGYDNQSRVFDGQSNINGKLQPAGTYFYSLDYKDGNETKHKTGFIVLKY